VGSEAKANEDSVKMNDRAESMEMVVETENGSLMDALAESEALTDALVMEPGKLIVTEPETADDGGRDVGKLLSTELGGTDVGTLLSIEDGGTEVGGTDVGTLLSTEVGGSEVGTLLSTEVGGSEVGTLLIIEVGGNEVGTLVSIDVGGSDVGVLGSAEVTGTEMGTEMGMEIGMSLVMTEIILLIGSGGAEVTGTLVGGSEVTGCVGVSEVTGCVGVSDVGVGVELGVSEGGNRILVKVSTMLEMIPPDGVALSLVGADVGVSVGADVGVSEVGVGVSEVGVGVSEVGVEVGTSDDAESEADVGPRALVTPSMMEVTPPTIPDKSPPSLELAGGGVLTGSEAEGAGVGVSVGAEEGGAEGGSDDAGGAELAGSGVGAVGGSELGDGGGGGGGGGLGSPNGKPRSLARPSTRPSTKPLCCFLAISSERRAWLLSGEEWAARTSATVSKTATRIIRIFYIKRML